MDLVTALLLGLLQGVLEWLPVSSQGILVVAMQLRGIDVASAIGIAVWLHVGTLGAAVVYLRDDLARIARELPETDSYGRRAFAFLVLATFATGLVGGPILVAGLDAGTWPAWAGTLAVGLLLTVTALGLHVAEPGVRGEETVALADAPIPGLLQGTAALPGISRSGMSLVGLFARGFSADAALRLSFLMSIPAIAGAQVGLGLLDPVPLTVPHVAAAAVALVVGVAAMDALIRLARRVRFAGVVAVLALAALLGSAWMYVAGVG